MKSAIASLLAGFLLVAGCTSRPAQRLVLAVQPTGTPEALSADAKEIEAFLEERLSGVDVEIRIPTLYAGVIEALRFGNADAAFMSAWPAALASRHAGAEVILAEVREVVIGEEKVERPFYYSYWVVGKESPFTSLGELRGRRAAFPSPLSTSGYVMPLARLVELDLVGAGKNGADPKQFFGEVTFAGGYMQGWEALRSGQVDVTVIAGDVPETLYRQVLAGTRVLDEQGPIPSHVVVTRKDLDAGLRDRLKTALLELGEPANRTMMRRFISGTFVRFEESTAERHLGPLNRSLEATRLELTERPG